MNTTHSIAVALFRCTVTLLAVGALTWITKAGLHVNSSTAAFSYLLLVLALAARAGLAESITASVAGMLAYNYFFLPPIGTLTIADPENWVALVVFVTTAITASHLSATVRKRALQADAREHEMQRMYDFSRALMLKDPEGSVPHQASRKLAEVFGLSDVWFYDAVADTVTGPNHSNTPITPAILQKVAQSGEVWQEGGGGAAIAVPVALGGQPFGSLAVSGPSAPSMMALRSVAQVAAIALESARAQEIAARMYAARENEQLKSTLLDALAHEFKTPLTSIKAATTSLLPHPNLDPTTRELITIVDEEADRLNSLVSDSIELARLGSQPVTLNTSVHSLTELISAALGQLRLLVEDRSVSVEIDDSLPPVRADRKLMELVLRQLIENALRYSPPSSPVRIKGEQDRTWAVTRISNSGPGIRKSEQDAIFEKFYRSRDTRGRVAGTGLGLAIAREIIEAHGGRIWVTSDWGHGAEFSFSLPLEASAPAALGKQQTGA